MNGIYEPGKVFFIVFSGCLVFLVILCGACLCRKLEKDSKKIAIMKRKLQIMDRENARSK